MYAAYASSVASSILTSALIRLLLAKGLAGSEEIREFIITSRDSMIDGMLKLDIPIEQIPIVAQQIHNQIDVTLGLLIDG